MMYETQHMAPSVPRTSKRKDSKMNKSGHKCKFCDKFIIGNMKGHMQAHWARMHPEMLNDGQLPPSLEKIRLQSLEKRALK